MVRIGGKTQWTLVIAWEQEEVLCMLTGDLTGSSSAWNLQMREEFVINSAWFGN